MKKRILGFALAAALIAALAGCGGSDSSEASSAASSAKAESTAAASSTKEESTAAASSTKEESTAAPAGETIDRESDTYLKANYESLVGSESVQGKKVGFTLISLGNDFMVSMSNGIKEALEAEGATVQVDACDGDPTKQQEQIENYTTMGMDLIIIFPVNGEAVVTAAENAEAAGVKVIAFAMDIPSEKLTCHVISANEDTMGRACGEMASKWIDENLADKDQVNVLMVGSTSSPELVMRSDNQEAAIKENPRCVVTRQDTPDSNSVDEGRNLAENMWLGDAQWDVVIAVNQQTAIGFNSYMMSSDGPLDDISKFAIFCVDETEEVIQNIQASKNNESCLRGTISMGAVSDTIQVVHDAAMTILTGGTVITHVDGDAIPVTAADV